MKPTKETENALFTQIRDPSVTLECLNDAGVWVKTRGNVSHSMYLAYNEGNMYRLAEVEQSK
jgi:hypothetical protein